MLRNESDLCSGTEEQAMKANLKKGSGQSLQ